MGREKLAEDEQAWFDEGAAPRPARPTHRGPRPLRGLGALDRRTRRQLAVVGALFGATLVAGAALGAFSGPTPPSPAPALAPSLSDAQREALAAAEQWDGTALLSDDALFVALDELAAERRADLAPLPTDDAPALAAVPDAAAPVAPSEPPPAAAPRAAVPTPAPVPTTPKAATPRDAPATAEAPRAPAVPSAAKAPDAPKDAPPIKTAPRAEGPIATAPSAPKQAPPATAAAPRAEAPPAREAPVAAAPPAPKDVTPPASTAPAAPPASGADPGQALAEAKDKAAKGDWKGAVSAYGAALAAAPGDAKALAGRGQAHYELRQLDLAARDFEAVLAQNPTHAAALLTLGSIAQDQGKKAQARSYYERYLKRYPSGRRAAEVQALLDAL